MSHTSFKKNCTYLSHGTSCNDLKWCPARQVWKKPSKLSPWNFMAFMVRLKWDISVSFSSHITMNNISVAFLRLISHCNALANISVSSTSHTTVASFRRLTHWQKPWHQYAPHTPHFIFTRVQPTIWMYGSIYEVYIQSKFQTSQKWKFSVSGAQTGAVSAMLKVTYLLVIARLFTRLRFSTSLLVIASFSSVLYFLAKGGLDVRSCLKTTFHRELVNQPTLQLPNKSRLGELS